MSGPFCNNITCQLDSEGEVSAIDALARDVGEIEKPAQPLGTAWAASGARLGARLLALGALREVTRRAPRATRWFSCTATKNAFMRKSGRVAQIPSLFRITNRGRRRRTGHRLRPSPLRPDVGRSSTSVSPANATAGDVITMTVSAEDGESNTLGAGIKYFKPNGNLYSWWCDFSPPAQSGSCTKTLGTAGESPFDVSGTYQFHSVRATDEHQNMKYYYSGDVSVPDITIESNP